jgi:CBS domain-containing protein
MFTAEEIMTEDVVTVREDTPILQAIEIMLAHRISGVPVVSKNMTLVGVLSEKDVVNLLYDLDSSEKNKVRNFMTARPVSFEKDDSLVDICDFLAKNLFRRVPITSKGKVVGIISIPDILKYILELRKEKHKPAQ